MYVGHFCRAAFAGSMPECVRRRHSVFGDLLETVSVKVKLEDQPDGVGGFFNDHDLPGVLVLEVTEGRDDHDPFFLLLPIGGTYLPAGILGIHVVDDLFHPDDKVIVLIAGIDVLSAAITRTSCF